MDKLSYMRIDSQLTTIRMTASRIGSLLIYADQLEIDIDADEFSKLNEIVKALLVIEENIDDLMPY